MHRRRFARVGARLLALSVASLWGERPSWATNGTWTNTAGGLWSTTSNWQGATVANGIDGQADFSTLNLTANATVNLDSARTIGSLKFGDTTPSNNTWTLANNGNASNTLTLRVSAGTPLITVNNTATISAQILGTSGYTVAGNGILQLTGSNGYTGTAIISAGSTVNAIWSAGGTFGPFPAGQTILNNGTLNIVRQSVDPQFKGIITGTGLTTIQGSGGGYVNLGDTGDNVARLSPQGDLNLTIGLNLFRNAQTIGALSGNGTVTSNASLGGTVNFTLGNNGNSATFSGVIDNAGSEKIQLIKKGSGTQVLTGANTYAGGTSIQAGNLQLGDGSTTNGSITGTVTMGGGNIIFANPTAQTFAGVFSSGGFGIVTKIGAGNLTFNSNQQILGTLNVNGGTITYDSGGSTGTLSAINVGATGVAGQSGTLIVTNNGNLAAMGGPLTVGAASGSSGTVTISAGAGTTFGDLTINKTGSLTVTSTGQMQIDHNINVNGGSLTTPGDPLKFRANNMANLTVQNAGTWTLTGAFSTPAPITYNITGANSTVNGSSLTIANNALFSVNSGGAMSFSGSIAAGTSLFQPGRINIDGAGSTVSTPTVSLGNATSGTGAAVLTNGGTLALSDHLSLDATGSMTVTNGNLIAPDVRFSAGGTLSFVLGSLNTKGDIDIAAGGIVLHGSTGTGNISPDKTLPTGRNLITTANTTILAGQTLSLTGGSLTTGALLGPGAVNFNDGNIAVSGASGITLGPGNNIPSLTVGDGAGGLASLTVTGTTTVSAAGTLILGPDGQLNGSGNLVNNHLLQIEGGVIGGTGSVTNNATLLIEGGVNIAKSGGISNAGQINFLSSGSTLSLNATTLTNDGVINFNGASIPLSGGGRLNNNATGRINGPGTIALTTFVVNAGVIDSGVGTLTINGPMTSTGTLRASGTLAVAINTFPVNNGTIDLAGGTFSSPFTSLNNAGLITGFGTLNVPTGVNRLVNNGQINLTNALVNGDIQNNPAAGIINATGNVSFNGNITGAGGATGSSNAGVIGVGAGAKLLLTPTANGARVAQARSIGIGPGGKLDLSNNKLATADPVGSWDGSNYTGITGLIRAGRNTGNWSGSGIVTSQSNATVAGLTSIGTATAQQVKGLASSSTTTTWSGVTVSGSDTLAMYTYAGDANLDGKIDVLDYGRIDLNTPLGTAGWFNGDFNYDGKINVLDYGIIDFNIAIQGPPISAGAEIAAISQAARPDGVTSVPEPTTVTCLAMTLTALLRRRRRVIRHSLPSREHERPMTNDE